MHSQGNMAYQPNPFGGTVSCVRSDCAKRYKDIRKFCDKIEHANVLDFGCAEGYFGFKFLLDGAASCTFIDNDKGCLKVVDSVAINNGLSTKVKIYDKIGTHDFYDIALCLDLWSEQGVPSLEQFSELCGTLFISTSGDGNQKNSKLLDAAAKVFHEVIPVHTGYQNRTIYRCTS